MTRLLYVFFAIVVSAAITMGDDAAPERGVQAKALITFEPLGNDQNKIPNGKATLAVVDGKLATFATGFTWTADAVPAPATGNVVFELQGMADRSLVVVTVNDQMTWSYEGDRRNFAHSPPIAVPIKNNARTFKLSIAVGKGPLSTGGIQTFSVREAKAFPPPAGWPVFANSLRGSSTITVKNPNDFYVRVGLRSGKDGTDVVIGSGLSESIQAPNGRFEIYFHYPSDEKSIYQGDAFEVKDKPLEIQIVKVIDGNYGGRKVK